MNNTITQTIYEGKIYEVPYSEMGSWLALQIAFSDKFSKYLKLKQ